ncbi:hypothetical protein Sdiek1_0141 [Sulfurospirillum diekertiae]|uniref:UPF0056 membrane protein n=1 Tax=Sulfurospirillum diekertiae TaxID=1854492 RepID=A0A1Y0HIS5_9BACT|nr:hypothetical protein Sdiek1_0141 [Sulfurospirillum diekertiae]
MNAEFSIVSTAILLMFVIDPFGAVPIILSILKDVDITRRRRIIIREMIFGLAILTLFLFGGELFFKYLSSGNRIGTYRRSSYLFCYWY